MTGEVLHDEQTMLLTWLAVKGMASREDIDRRWGADTGIGAVLERLVSNGELDRDADVYFLTEYGDGRLSQAYQDALTGAEQAEFGQFVSKFDPIDLDLKAVATKWQLTAGRADDDVDDALLEVLETLLDVDTRLHEAVADSPPVVARVLSSYITALESARERLLSGSKSAFTGTDDSSYHSVWFVMHEVILRTAGQSR
jgi:hypothetical protein